MQGQLRLGRPGLLEGRRPDRSHKNNEKVTAFPRRPKDSTVDYTKNFLKNEVEILFKVAPPSI